MPLDSLENNNTQQVPKPNTPEVNQQNAQATVETNEVSFLEGLKRARDYTVGNLSTYKIQISDDDGIEFFSFYVRPLKQKEFKMARKMSIDKNARRRGEDNEIDDERYACEIIYRATVPDENGVKIWERPEVLQLCNTMKYWDAITDLIRGGLIFKVLRKIEEISGFSFDDSGVTLINESKN